MTWAHEANGALDMDNADLRDEREKERKQLEREREAMKAIISAGDVLANAWDLHRTNIGSYAQAWDAAVAQYEAARGEGR